MTTLTAGPARAIQSSWRGVGRPLEHGDATDRIQSDIPRLNIKMLRSERMPKLVKHNASKHRDDQKGPFPRAMRREPTPN